MTTPAQLNTSLTGRYDVEREIGRGGMATVYLARDVRHNRRVALKVLNPELGAVLGVERFLAEIQVTANLQHPNLLPLFDSGEANGLLFYVMPYVDGESLRARLDREKQLPVDEAVRIASAVASALHYAHGHGVIHRDLKPENILIQAGQPVVADFGIALAVSNAGGARVTQTGLSLGTPQYMSPEQATGDRVIDPRADIYSLAAVAYEMLAGEPPHTGNTMQAVIARVLTEQPRHIRAVRPNVPEHVEQALERGLEKLPADRWSTAKEFAEALEGRAAPQSRATDGHHAATRKAGRSWGKRLTDPVVLVLAAATLGATVLSVVQWNAGRQPPESRATVRFPLTLPRDVQLTPTVVQSLAISRDGRHVAFAARGQRGVSQLFVREMDDATVRAVPGTDGTLSAFFSPDGKWIAFTDAQELKKVAIESGAVLTLADIGGVFGGASWAKNGQILIATANSRIVVMPENGGPGRRLCRNDPAGSKVESSPLVLDDGETVLYSSWPSLSFTNAKLAVASLSTGTCTILDIDGLQPLGVVGRRVLYVSNAGALTAVEIDLAARRVISAPVPVLTDIVVHASSGTAQAALSSSGTLVYQGGAVPTELVWSDLHGAAEPITIDERSYGYPRLSPDGRKIALTVISAAQRDIWIYDIPSRGSTRLTPSGGMNERPEWSPDGKRVLYRAARGERVNLWWRSADLSEPEAPLLKSESEDYYEGVITPDGGAIVYQIDTGGADVMYRYLKGDTTKKPISNTTFVESQARVSPNGQWVAFVTTESGSDEVVVQPFPGPGPRTQISANGGREPVWSRDGKRLFYRDPMQFVAATVRTDIGFSVTARESLFPDTFVRGPYHANYDVSLDGSHLLLLRAKEQPQVMIVHNWSDELRARLAGPERR